MKNKLIIVYVNQGFALRYLLRTDILKTISKNDNQIIILSHNGNEEVFKSNFERKNILVKKCKNEKYEEYLNNNKLQRILIQLRAYVLNGKYDTKTVDDFRKIFLGQLRWSRQDNYRGWFKGLCWESISWLLKNIKILRNILVKFETLFFTPSYHDEIFNEYNPDLVVVTGLCGFEYNEYFAREAKKYGVPVCCVVLSWDNTSGMGMPGYDPDYIIAWTENMRKELIELNDIDDKKIFVGGVAHFDPYYHNNNTLNKELLFAKLGLDLKKKTIFYATKSPKRFPWGPQLVADLAKAISDGDIKFNSQILVRIHPLHYRSKNGKLMFQNILDEYEMVANQYPSVILNIPTTVSKIMDFDLSESETKLISSILTHSDVMLNMFSTMVIEAAIFDLPAINVCIRERCKVDLGRSRQDIMVDFVQTHNQRVIQTGGVKTVFTTDELYKAVNKYLDNAASDASGRELIRINEAGPHPGKAGEIIGKHLLSLVHSN